MNKSEDLLKSVLANIEGKNVKDIELEEISSKKINKKNKIKEKNIVINNPSFSNGEGLAVCSSEQKLMEWSELKIKKNVFKEKSSIDEWNTHDFFRYTSELYDKTFKRDGFWNLRLGGASLEIKKLYDLLEGTFGFKTNLMVKDYIDYFFKYFAKKYKSKNGNFYFSQLRNDEVIVSFSSNYDFKKSMNDYLSKNNKNDVSHSLDLKDVNASYKVSTFSLLLNYGIIIPFNWLLLNKKIDKDIVIKRISDDLKKAVDENIIDVIIKKTEEYSPYPDWFVFKQAEYILELIGVKKKINAKFVHDDKISDKYKNIRKGKK